jgi:ABC-type lipoprotein release transport system permease subunit
MIYVCKYAWLNTYRHKQRTAITVGAVAATTIILISLFVLFNGFMARTIDGFTNTFSGKIQAHAFEYRDEQSFYKALKSPDNLLKIARENSIQAAPRSYGFGLAAKNNKSSGVMFIGLNPDNEREGFKLPDHIYKGSFIEQDSRGGAMIGKKLSLTLNANVGDEIVVVVQAADGSMGDKLFTIKGIFNLIGDEFDRSTLVIHARDFEDLFVSGGRIHQIAFNVNDKRNLESVVDLLRRHDTENEIKSWKELFSGLYSIMAMTESFLFIITIVFGIGGAIGVLNTLLMACFERVKEYGILKSIGTSSFKLFSSTIIEGFIMGMIGSIIGVIVSFAVSIYLRDVGIDMSNWIKDISVMGIAVDPVWRGAITLKPFIYVPTIMIAICVVASIYPALMVSRLNPAEAMRHE